MWNYKDDHTDMRVLGAIAKALPELFKLESLEKYITEKMKNPAKLESALMAYKRFAVTDVKAGEGNQEKPYSFVLPGASKMREGVSVEASPLGGPYNSAGGYKSGRPDKLMKFSSRTLRPVVDFSVCTKCTLCWLQCQDGSFDVTPDGYYDPNMEYCMGCGVCEAVCPVPNCITMVNELAFSDNANQYAAYTQRQGRLQGVAEDEDSERPAPRPWLPLSRSVQRRNSRGTGNR